MGFGVDRLTPTTLPRIAAFLAMGYTNAQVLDVIFGVSFKTLSNYVNHVAGTPLDDAFATQAWAPIVNQLRQRDAGE